MKVPHRLASLTLPLLLVACSTTNPRSARLDSHEEAFLHTRDDHGNPMGCSWYCGAPPITVSASSTHRDGIYSYAAANAHDGKRDTVWVEGADGLGIGERITFSFDLTDQERFTPDHPPLGISTVSIINGFARSETLWKANARVKTLKITFNGKNMGTIQLDDTAEPSWIDLPKMTFTRGRIDKVAFEIVAVYPGEQFEDTALADFFFSGFGVH